VPAHSHVTFHSPQIRVGCCGAEPAPEKPFGQQPARSITRMKIITTLLSIRFITITILEMSRLLTK
jgi:hypothetical protein